MLAAALIDTALQLDKNLAEILQLQGDYWQKLCGNLTSQAEEVRALSSKVTAAAGEQVKRGVDELRKAK